MYKLDIKNKKYENFNKFLNKNLDIIKNSSNNIKFLCPFHKEKTPSFSISLEKKCFFCFGCGIKGGLNNLNIDFKKKENIFKENIFKKKIIKDKIHLNEMILILGLNEKLKDFFIKNINNSRTAKEFLIKRNINNDTLKYFEIGYSDYYSFIRFLNKNRFYKKKIFMETGIIKCKDIKNDKNDKNNKNDKNDENYENKYYNILNNRIIFPIKNINGDIVSFSGRILSEEKPKYINSRETFFYKKKFHLYGIYENKKYIEKMGYAIIVEGYLDVLSLFQNNFKNVLGLMGTAINEYIMKLILTLTKNCLFCLDGDKAGFLCIKKILDLFSSYNNFKYKYVYFVILLKGSDPDEFINRYGRKEFKKRILKSVRFINMIYLIYIKNIFSSPRVLLKKINRLNLFLKKMKNDELRLEIFYEIIKNDLVDFKYFFYIIDEAKIKIVDKKFNFYEELLLLYLILFPKLSIFCKFFIKKYKKLAHLSGKSLSLLFPLFYFLEEILKKIITLKKLNFFNLIINLNSSKNYKIFKYIIIKNKNIKINNLLNEKYIKYHLIKISINFNIIYKKILFYK